VEVAAAASIAAPIWGQEPPETAGEGEEAEAEGAGACAGACTPPPKFAVEFEFELELPGELELPELDPPLTDDCVAVLVELWPWNDLAAATAMTPVSTMAPAMSQPVTRRISSNPASRALTALFLTPLMLARRRKKKLSPR
jgi:hypothetical protein